MNKIILAMSVLVSLPLWAQTEKDVVKQLDSINNMKNDAFCETCESSKKLTYSPQDALKDINNGKLTFLGRDLFPGSDQNRTCVYKTETAYVLYGNCMASKKEAAATDITVISMDGGIMHFYIENAQDGAISEMNRSQYNSTWTIDHASSLPPGKLDVAGLKNYMNTYSVSNNKSGGCFVGGSFKAQDMSVRTQCYGPMKGSAKQTEWAKDADPFWRDPGQQWYDTLKSLRKTVVSTKF